MIGRLARNDTLAEVGVFNILKVAAAALLILSAFAVRTAYPEMHTAVIVLSAASLCFTGFPIVWEAFQGLIRLRTNVDELVSIAIIASLALGEWISAAIVAFIMVLGGLLEEYTSARARRAIKALAAGSPGHALLIGDDGATRPVPLAEIRPSQLVLARPGDVIAVDGVVIEGESDVDESMLTGESMPVPKQAGESVFAGTVNQDGALRIRVERVGAGTIHGRIVYLVTEAERHRAPILRAAQRYAQWFTPAVLLLAGSVYVLTGDPYRAVTMLIVGCPCAFVLATPTAVIAALGRASKRGILVKGGKYLEACAKVDVVAFDKTGTLTSGDYRLSDVIPLDGVANNDLLRHAARLEASAEHPIAHAIVAEATRRGLRVSAAPNMRREAGLGVTEIVDDAESCAWRIGNERFLERHGVAIPPPTVEKVEALREQGLSALYLAYGDCLKGILTLEDQARPEAEPALEALRSTHSQATIMLTGDARTVAARVAGELRFEDADVHSESLPEDKYAHIAALQEAGRRVCYVGDGANDGPALAVATVGVSIGSRENTVALETADIVLMKDGLSGLPFLFNLAKTTTRTINQNLILFGLLFNAGMLYLSASGALTPIMGALGHNLGSVAVVLNSARLLRFKDAA